MSMIARAGLESSTDELKLQNYYERLGVSPDATRSAIRVAYSKFRMRYMKEIDASNPAIHDRVRLMSEAFNHLKSEQSRAAYNRANNFTMTGPGSEKEFFKTNADSAAETAERFERGVTPRAPLSDEVKKQIENLHLVKRGALGRADEKRILSILDQREIHPDVAVNLSKALLGVTEWSPEMWGKISDKFSKMRPGVPWYSLVAAVSRQKSWPPNFRSSVDATLRFDAVGNGDIAAEKNIRVAAVDLLLSRKNEVPSPDLIRTLESFLESHHGSDLFRKTVLILEKASFSRTERMDRLLVEAMGAAYLGDVKQIPSYGLDSNPSLQLFLRSNSVPASIWPMLKEALSDEAQKAGAMNAVALLGQKAAVPEAVTELFLKNIADARNPELMPAAFSHMEHPEAFGFKNGHVLRIDKFRCETKSCVSELLRAARRMMGPFEMVRADTSKLLLQMIQHSISSNLALMDDSEISRGIRDVLNNAKSFSQISKESKAVQAIIKRTDRLQSKAGHLHVEALTAKLPDADVSCQKRFSFLKRFFKSKN